MQLDSSVHQGLLVTKLQQASLDIGSHDLTPMLPCVQQGLPALTCSTELSGLPELPLPLTT